MKVLLHREIPLVLDGDTSDDEFEATKYEIDMIRREHPDWEDNTLWRIELHTLVDDVKILYVTVSDPNATDWRENLKVAIAILVLGTMLFFIGLYG